MLTNETIRKLADYVLLNACSVSSTGLYNGKAGMSLCLFEVARYLNDEYFEEQAFELLQESLLSKNDDIGFENGLSGIGYVLQYLIDREFVDADFDEFFGEQTARILAGLEKRKNEPMNLLNSLSMIQFLSAINQSKNDPAIAAYIKTIFEAAELYLSIQFHDFTSINYRGSKATVLAVFEDYLRLVDFSAYPDFSPSLLEAYAGLYRQGRLASSYAIGCYLEKIATIHPLPDYADVIQSNKKYALLNIHPDRLTLRERLELMQLMFRNQAEDRLGKDRLNSGLEDVSDDVLEQKILKLIPNNAYIPGYGGGVARFLKHFVTNAESHTQLFL